MNKKLCCIIIPLYIFSILTTYLSTGYAFEEPVFALIRKAEKKAELRRIEAEGKAKDQRLEARRRINAIDNYYNKGKRSYEKGYFLDAVVTFEELLKVEPDYEPAKLYLKCAIIQNELETQESKIEKVKLEMSDIAAEYEKKVKRVEGLGFTYLLEKALLQCQAGNYDGAEYFYKMCYKLDPRAEEKISWFIDSTYELKDLADSLNESYRIIEELPELELEDLVSQD